MRTADPDGSNKSVFPTQGIGQNLLKLIGVFIDGNQVRPNIPIVQVIRVTWIDAFGLRSGVLAVGRSISMP